MRDHWGVQLEAQAVRMKRQPDLRIAPGRENPLEEHHAEPPMGRFLDRRPVPLGPAEMQLARAVGGDHAPFHRHATLADKAP